MIAPNLDYHALRHTFASAMIKATKGDAEKVRRWTGHADIKVLLERYSHEFQAARGGRRVEADIAEMDAAMGLTSQLHDERTQRRNHTRREVSPQLRGNRSMNNWSRAAVF